jgi:hypothetical protein
MCAIIQGIPVVADRSLPRNAIKQLVCELIETWKWEGIGTLSESLISIVTLTKKQD